MTSLLEHRRLPDPAIILTCLLTLIALAWSHDAAAQSPGASNSSNESSLAQDLESAPKPGTSGVQFTLGGQVQDGRTETKGLNIDGIIAHQTKKKQVWRVDIETGYAWYRATLTTAAIKVEDNQRTSLTYMHPLKKRVWLLGYAGYRRDAILGLDYRAWVEGAAGVEAITTKRVNSFIGGGYAVGKEKRNFTTVGSDVLDVAFLQTLNIKVTGVLGFEEWFKGHFDTTGADDGDYSLNASFMARVSKHTGMKIYYQRQYDALHPATQSATQYTLGAGVSITFPAK